jgi:antitoxin ParD1/3/4
MRSTQQLSITLPTEMAEAIKSKVASGEYATESEVIRDGLRALLALIVRLRAGFRIK